MTRCARRWTVHIVASVREGETVWCVPWCGYAVRWDRWSYAARVGACVPGVRALHAAPAVRRGPRKGRPVRARALWPTHRQPLTLPRRRAPVGDLPHRVAHTKWGTASRSGAQGPSRGATAHKAAGRGAGDGGAWRGASTLLHRAIRRGVDGRSRNWQWVASSRAPSLESHPGRVLGRPTVHHGAHGDTNVLDAPRHGVCVKGRSAGVCNTLGIPRLGAPAEPRECLFAGGGCGAPGRPGNPLGNPRAGGLGGR